MAAVIIANLRKHRADSHAVLEDMHAIFPRNDSLHLGTLQKRAFFSGAVTWRSIECAVTDSNFAMGNIGSNTLIDRIPLEEIENVRSAKAKDIDHKMQRGKIQLGSQGKSQKMIDLNMEDEKSGELMCFEITTVQDGYNHGRKYQFRGSMLDGSDIEIWVKVIKDASKRARDEKANLVKRSCGETVIARARALRENNYVQLAFGLAICLSFILSVLAAELRPADGSQTARALDYCDWVLTGIFVVELLINFLADFFFGFFKSPWNLFDLIVVTSSIVSSAQPSADMNLGALRIIRVLRAVRLLNHAGSLKQIVHAMFASVLPVANSFVLLTLIMCIYATMGVNLFGDEHPHYFGSFTTGLFTMFECATQDGWSEIVRRISADEDASTDELLHEATIGWVPILFFISFMIIGSIVLINIVIAVLLDEFLTTMANARTASQEEAKRSEIGFEDHSLEPLMELLEQFRSIDDLALTIEHLYERLDVDQSGTVGFAEAQEGLRKWMNIYLSKADWEDITSGQSNEDGEVTSGRFRDLIIHQLKLHILRNLNRAMMQDDTSPRTLTPVLKFLMISPDAYPSACASSARSAHDDTSGLNLGTEGEQENKTRQSKTPAGAGVNRRQQERTSTEIRLAGLEAQVQQMKDILQRQAEQADKQGQILGLKLDALLNQRNTESSALSLSSESRQESVESDAATQGRGEATATAAAGRGSQSLAVKKDISASPLQRTSEAAVRVPSKDQQLHSKKREDVLAARAGLRGKPPRPYTADDAWLRNKQLQDGDRATTSPRPENGDGRLSPLHKTEGDKDAVVDEQHGDWAGAHLQGQSVSFEEEACMSMAAADVSRGDDALQSFSDSHTAPFASFDNV